MEQWVCACEMTNMNVMFMDLWLKTSITQKDADYVMVPVMKLLHGMMCDMLLQNVRKYAKP